MECPCMKFAARVLKVRSVFFSGFRVACFLVIADARLLTGCMVLQTARSVMIAVCEGQLA